MSKWPPMNPALIWPKRWCGFTSIKSARSFIRKVDNQCHGKLRVVRILRQPVPER